MSQGAPKEITISHIDTNLLNPAPYNPRRNNLTPLICKQCETPFKDYTSNHRLFCSKFCYTQWQKFNNNYKGKISLKCDCCLRTFEKDKSLYDKGVKASPKKEKLNFCSYKCSAEYFRNHIYDWRNNSKGENNPAWRGGISKLRARIEASKEYQDFRLKILCRDGHKCRICGSNDRPEIHHIIAFHVNQNLFIEESNAITLCYKHHNQTKQKEHLYINIFNEVLRTNHTGQKAQCIN